LEEACETNYQLLEEVFTMLRSMFTAIGALNQQQSYLDVVANNLANANTVGYKASRVIFQDQFAQLLNPGSSPTANMGGTNPTQIGLGVQMGSVSPDFSRPGTMQNTGRSLDLAVQGDGFFIYSNGGEISYGREGALIKDSSGYLVNSSTGYRIQGWTVDNNASLDTNLPVTDIKIPANKTIAKSTGTVTLGGNLPSDYEIGTVDATTGAITPADYTPITVTMGVYDSLGNMHTTTVSFVHTVEDASGLSTWTWVANDIPDASGNPTQGNIQFDSTGAIQKVSGDVPTATVTLPVSESNAQDITMTLNFGDLTQLEGDSTAQVTTQDGLPAGTISDIAVSPNDGSIYLVYSNGMSEQFGTIALARFSNPSGLLRSGNTTFQQGFNSGEPQVGTATTGGRGAVSVGYLEGSNVDMAQEFTNMILAQRGFQASSRVITTSDEIIQELVNLKR
jgi:flagellar hook protein FlgE